MKREIILTNQAPAPIGPYSQAVWCNGILFCSGQIAIDAKTGNMVQDSIEAETHKVMQNIGALLSEAGLGYQNIVKSSIFLSDMNNFSKVNSVYATYFNANFPARETVEVSRLPKDAKVEISVIAAP